MSKTTHKISNESISKIKSIAIATYNKHINRIFINATTRFPTYSTTIRAEILRLSNFNETMNKNIWSL